MASFEHMVPSFEHMVPYGFKRVVKGGQDHVSWKINWSFLKSRSLLITFATTTNITVHDEIHSPFSFRGESFWKSRFMATYEIIIHNK